MDEPLPYVVAHLHEALMADERLNEQAIEIVIVGSRLELRGEGQCLGHLVLGRDLRVGLSRAGGVLVGGTRR